MDSGVIYDSLYRHFINYEYKLFNSYIYDWECDFFGMSKSGYFYEVEVKISRGDYFADFKKDKHELFTSFFKKKTHHIYKTGWLGHDKERIICEFIQPKIEFDYTGKPNRSHHFRQYNWQMANYRGKTGYLVNDFGGYRIYSEKVRVMANATSIRIKAIDEIKCPNCFYYACPEGMIKENELPEYAGLLFIDVLGNVRLFKKAPYLHKQKPNMSGLLLKKFYNLWQYSVSKDKKMEIFKSTQ